MFWYDENQLTGRCVDCSFRQSMNNSSNIGLIYKYLDKIEVKSFVEEILEDEINAVREKG